VEWFLSHLALLLGIILTVVVIAAMLRQRRSPQSAVAWLLSILVFPYVAVPAYLILGRRKLNLCADIPAAKLDEASPETIPAREATRSDLMLRSYGIPGATTGNRVRMLATGQEGWQGLTEVIDRARKTLDVETFIFSTDATGREILNRLVQKAESGVQVRLLIDAIGSFHTPQQFLEPLIRAGGTVARFMPLLHNPLRGKTNLRNHRKITVADNRWAMAGGMNIVSEDMSPEARAGQWSDLSFVVEGPAALQYARIFRSDWQLSSGGAPIPEPVAEVIPHDDDHAAVVQVLPSGPDMAFDTIYDTVMTAAFEARERLWIITPYFVPDDALTKGLVIACHRGIDVRILVPDRSNHPLTDMAGASFLREIEAAGGTILRYTRGMVHAKTLIMDRSLAMAGSANMDLRSFFLNCEVMQLCYSLPEVTAIEKYALLLMADCRTGMPVIGAGRELLEAIIRLGAPLL
jgi:cardiolipin synthase